jgi:hypothetical protein
VRQLKGSRAANFVSKIKPEPMPLLQDAKLLMGSLIADFRINYTVRAAIGAWNILLHPTAIRTAGLPR